MEYLMLMLLPVVGVASMNALKAKRERRRRRALLNNGFEEDEDGNFNREDVEIECNSRKMKVGRLNIPEKSGEVLYHASDTFNLNIEDTTYEIPDDIGMSEDIEQEELLKNIFPAILTQIMPKVNLNFTNLKLKQGDKYIEIPTKRLLANFQEDTITFDDNDKQTFPIFRQNTNKTHQTFKIHTINTENVSIEPQEIERELESNEVTQIEMEKEPSSCFEISEPNQFKINNPEEQNLRLELNPFIVEWSDIEYRNIETCTNESQKDEDMDNSKFTTPHNSDITDTEYEEEDQNDGPCSNNQKTPKPGVSSPNTFEQYTTDAGERLLIEEQSQCLDFSNMYNNAKRVKLGISDSEAVQLSPSHKSLRTSDSKDVAVGKPTLSLSYSMGYFAEMRAFDLAPSEAFETVIEAKPELLTFSNSESVNSEYSVKSLEPGNLVSFNSDKESSAFSMQSQSGMYVSSPPRTKTFEISPTFISSYDPSEDKVTIVFDEAEGRRSERAALQRSPVRHYERALMSPLGLSEATTIHRSPSMLARAEPPMLASDSLLSLEVDREVDGLSMSAAGSFVFDSDIGELEQGTAVSFAALDRSADGREELSMSFADSFNADNSAVELKVEGADSVAVPERYTKLKQSDSNSIAFTDGSKMEPLKVMESGDSIEVREKYAKLEPSDANSLGFDVNSQIEPLRLTEVADSIEVREKYAKLEPSSTVASEAVAPNTHLSMSDVEMKVIGSNESSSLENSAPLAHGVDSNAKLSISPNVNQFGKAENSSEMKIANSSLLIEPNRKSLQSSEPLSHEVTKEDVIAEKPSEEITKDTQSKEMKPPLKPSSSEIFETNEEHNELSLSAIESQQISNGNKLSINALESNEIRERINKLNIAADGQTQTDIPSDGSIALEQSIAQGFNRLEEKSKLSLVQTWGHEAERAEEEDLTEDDASFEISAAESHIFKGESPEIALEVTDPYAIDKNEADFALEASTPLEHSALSTMELSLSAIEASELEKPIKALSIGQTEQVNVSAHVTELERSDSTTFAASEERPSFVMSQSNVHESISKAPNLKQGSSVAHSTFSETSLNLSGPLTTERDTEKLSLKTSDPIQIENKEPIRAFELSEANEIEVDAKAEIEIETEKKPELSMGVFSANERIEEKETKLEKTPSLIFDMEKPEIALELTSSEPQTAEFNEQRNDLSLSSLECNEKHEKKSALQKGGIFSHGIDARVEKEAKTALKEGEVVSHDILSHDTELTRSGSIVHDIEQPQNALIVGASESHEIEKQDKELELSSLEEHNVPNNYQTLESSKSMTLDINDEVPKLKLEIDNPESVEINKEQSDEQFEISSAVVNTISQAKQSEEELSVSPSTFVLSISESAEETLKRTELKEGELLSHSIEAKQNELSFSEISTAESDIDVLTKSSLGITHSDSFAKPEKQTELGLCNSDFIEIAEIEREKESEPAAVVEKPKEQTKEKLTMSNSQTIDSQNEEENLSVSLPEYREIPSKPSQLSRANTISINRASGKDPSLSINKLESKDLITEKPQLSEGGVFSRSVESTPRLTVKSSQEVNVSPIERSKLNIDSLEGIDRLEKDNKEKNKLSVGDSESVERNVDHLLNTETMPSLSLNPQLKPKKFEISQSSGFDFIELESDQENTESVSSSQSQSSLEYPEFEISGATFNNINPRMEERELILSTTDYYDMIQSETPKLVEGEALTHVAQSDFAELTVQSDKGFSVSPQEIPKKRPELNIAQIQEYEKESHPNTLSMCAPESSEIMTEPLKLDLSSMESINRSKRESLSLSTIESTEALQRRTQLEQGETLSHESEKEQRALSMSKSASIEAKTAQNDLSFETVSGVSVSPEPRSKEDKKVKPNVVEFASDGLDLEKQPQQLDLSDTSALDRNEETRILSSSDAVSHQFEHQQSNNLSITSLEETEVEGVVRAELSVGNNPMNFEKTAQKSQFSIIHSGSFINVNEEEQKHQQLSMSSIQTAEAIKAPTNLTVDNLTATDVEPSLIKEKHPIISDTTMFEQAEKSTTLSLTSGSDIDIARNQFQPTISSSMAIQAETEQPKLSLATNELHSIEGKEVELSSIELSSKSKVEVAESTSFERNDSGTLKIDLNRAHAVSISKPLRREKAPPFGLSDPTFVRVEGSDHQVMVESTPAIIDEQSESTQDGTSENNNKSQLSIADQSHMDIVNDIQKQKLSAALSHSASVELSPSTLILAEGSELHMGEEEKKLLVSDVSGLDLSEEEVTKKREALLDVSPVSASDLSIQLAPLSRGDSIAHESINDSNPSLALSSTASTEAVSKQPSLVQGQPLSHTMETHRKELEMSNVEVSENSVSIELTMNSQPNASVEPDFSKAKKPSLKFNQTEAIEKTAEERTLDISRSESLDFSEIENEKPNIAIIENNSLSFEPITKQFDISNSVSYSYAKGESEDTTVLSLSATECNESIPSQIQLAEGESISHSAADDKRLLSVSGSDVKELPTNDPQLSMISSADANISPIPIAKSRSQLNIGELKSVQKTEETKLSLGKPDGVNRSEIAEEKIQSEALPVVLSNHGNENTKFEISGLLINTFEAKNETEENLSISQASITESKIDITELGEGEVLSHSTADKEDTELSISKSETTESTQKDVALSTGGTISHSAEVAQRAQLGIGESNGIESLPHKTILSVSQSASNECSNEPLEAPKMQLGISEQNGIEKKDSFAQLSVSQSTTNEYSKVPAELSVASSSSIDVKPSKAKLGMEKIEGVNKSDSSAQLEVSSTKSAEAVSAIPELSLDKSAEYQINKDQKLSVTSNQDVNVSPSQIAKESVAPVPIEVRSQKADLHINDTNSVDVELEQRKLEYGQTDGIERREERKVFESSEAVILNIESQDEKKAVLVVADGADNFEKGISKPEFQLTHSGSLIDVNEELVHEGLTLSEMESAEAIQEEKKLSLTNSEIAVIESRKSSFSSSNNSEDEENTEKPEVSISGSSAFEQAESKASLVHGIASADFNIPEKSPNLSFAAKEPLNIESKRSYESSVSETLSFQTDTESPRVALEQEDNDVFDVQPTDSINKQESGKKEFQVEEGDSFERKQFAVSSIDLTAGKIIAINKPLKRELVPNLGFSNPTFVKFEGESTGIQIENTPSILEASEESNEVLPKDLENSSALTFENFNEASLKLEDQHQFEVIGDDKVKELQMTDAKEFSIETNPSFAISLPEQHERIPLSEAPLETKNSLTFEVESEQHQLSFKSDHIEIKPEQGKGTSTTNRAKLQTGDAVEHNINSKQASFTVSPSSTSFEQVNNETLAIDDTNEFSLPIAQKQVEVGDAVSHEFSGIKQTNSLEHIDEFDVTPEQKHQSLSIGDSNSHESVLVIPSPETNISESIAEQRYQESELKVGETEGFSIEQSEENIEEDNESSSSSLTEKVEEEKPELEISTPLLSNPTKLSVSSLEEIISKEPVSRSSSLVLSGEQWTVYEEHSSFDTKRQLSVSESITADMSELPRTDLTVEQSDIATIGDNQKHLSQAFTITPLDESITITPTEKAEISLTIAECEEFSIEKLTPLSEEESETSSSMSEKDESTTIAKNLSASSQEEIISKEPSLHAPILSLTGKQWVVHEEHISVSPKSPLSVSELISSDLSELPKSEFTTKRTEIATINEPIKRLPPVFAISPQTETSITPSERVNTKEVPAFEVSAIDSFESVKSMALTTSRSELTVDPEKQKPKQLSVTETTDFTQCESTNLSNGIAGEFDRIDDTVLHVGPSSSLEFNARSKETDTELRIASTQSLDQITKSLTLNESIPESFDFTKPDSSSSSDSEDVPKEDYKANSGEEDTEMKKRFSFVPSTTYVEVLPGEALEAKTEKTLPKLSIVSGAEFSAAPAPKKNFIAELNLNTSALCIAQPEQEPFAISVPSIVKIKNSEEIVINSSADSSEAIEEPKHYESSETQREIIPLQLSEAGNIGFSSEQKQMELQQNYNESSNINIPQTQKKVTLEESPAAAHTTDGMNPARLSVGESTGFHSAKASILSSQKSEPFEVPPSEEISPIRIRHNKNFKVSNAGELLEIPKPYLKLTFSPASSISEPPSTNKLAASKVKASLETSEVRMTAAETEIKTKLEYGSPISCDVNKATMLTFGLPTSSEVLPESEPKRALSPMDVHESMQTEIPSLVTSPSVSTEHSLRADEGIDLMPKSSLSLDSLSALEIPHSDEDKILDFSPSYSQNMVEEQKDEKSSKAAKGSNFRFSEPSFLSIEEDIIDGKSMTSPKQTSQLVIDTSGTKAVEFKSALVQSHIDEVSVQPSNIPSSWPVIEKADMLTQTKADTPKPNEKPLLSFSYSSEHSTRDVGPSLLSVSQPVSSMFISSPRMLRLSPSSQVKAFTMPDPLSMSQPMNAQTASNETDKPVFAMSHIESTAVGEFSPQRPVVFNEFPERESSEKPHYVASAIEVSPSTAFIVASPPHKMTTVFGCTAITPPKFSSESSSSNSSEDEGKDERKERFPSVNENLPEEIVPKQKMIAESFAIFERTESSIGSNKKKPILELYSNKSFTIRAKLSSPFSFNPPPLPHFEELLEGRSEADCDIPAWECIKDGVYQPYIAKSEITHLGYDIESKWEAPTDVVLVESPSQVIDANHIPLLSIEKENLFESEPNKSIGRSYAPHLEFSKAASTNINETSAGAIEEAYMKMIGEYDRLVEDKLALEVHYDCLGSHFDAFKKATQEAFEESYRKENEMVKEISKLEAEKKALNNSLEAFREAAESRIRQIIQRNDTDKYFPVLGTSSIEIYEFVPALKDASTDALPLRAAPEAPQQKERKNCLITTPSAAFAQFSLPVRLRRTGEVVLQSVAPRIISQPLSVSEAFCLDKAHRLPQMTFAFKHLRISPEPKPIMHMEALPDIAEIRPRMPPQLSTASAQTENAKKRLPAVSLIVANSVFAERSDSRKLAIGGVESNIEPILEPTDEHDAKAKPKSKVSFSKLPERKEKLFYSPIVSLTAPPIRISERTIKPIKLAVGRPILFESPEDDTHKPEIDSAARQAAARVNAAEQQKDALIAMLKRRVTTLNEELRLQIQKREELVEELGTVRSNYAALLDQ